MNIRSYLLEWKNNHKDWKFQKSKQNWIIRNIYTMEKDLFKIAIKYLKTGSIKPFVIENAQTIIAKELPDEESVDYKRLKTQRKRARKIVKLG